MGKQSDYQVCDYRTGDVVGDTADERLLAESVGGSVEGACMAWLDDGVWRWCSEQAAATYRNRGEDVRTVYVRD